MLISMPELNKNDLKIKKKNLNRKPLDTLNTHPLKPTHSSRDILNPFMPVALENGAIIFVIFF